MASINFATREINCKIVYYGPGLSGKTTNLQVIHQKLPQDKRSDMVSLATEQDRTLFFDFLPLDLGSIKGFKTKFQLYTVPGQVYYNSTRKLVLRGVDGVVFVADSQKNRMAENLESLQNLSQNLKEYGFDLEQIPYVLQYNKRDMPDVFTVDELNARLNPGNIAYYEAVSHVGRGVVATLKAVSKKVIDKFNKRQSSIGGGTPPARATTLNKKPTSAGSPSSLSPSKTDLKPVKESIQPKPVTNDDLLDLRAPEPSPATKVPSPSSLGDISRVGDSSSTPNPFAPKKPQAHEEKSTLDKKDDKKDDNRANEEIEDIELRPYVPKSDK